MQTTLFAFLCLAATVIGSAVITQARDNSAATCDPKSPTGILKPTDGQVVKVGQSTGFLYCSPAYNKESSISLSFTIASVQKPNQVVFETDKFDRDTTFSTGYATNFAIPVGTAAGKYSLVTSENATGSLLPYEVYTYKITLIVAH